MSSPDLVADGILPKTTQGIATLAKSIREALDRFGEPRLAAEEIRHALSRALACEDLVAEKRLVPDFGSYRQEILYVDPAGSFSIAALVWLPGHRTPVHDHRCWCCFGVWRGREVETHYGIGPQESLVPLAQTTRYAGDVEFLNPPGDIHQVSNDDTVPTISIHIYGADLLKAGTSILRRYDPDQGPGSRDNQDEQTFAVIGGGFSGTMASIHLLRRSGPGARVVLFESSAEPGRGAAYGTKCLAHLLNVPAGGMSAFADQPDHFLEWCHRRGRNVAAGDFLPRAWYGEYLGDLLRDEVVHSQARFEIRTEAVERIESKGRTLHLLTADHQALDADAVLLAIGSPPERARPLFPAASDWPAMIDPWQAGALNDSAPDQSVLVVGTGLTFMDVIAELAARGHRGPIHAISRRGLLPTTHHVIHPAPRFDVEGFRQKLAGMEMRVSVLCRHVRQAVENAAGIGADWREVVNAMRPLTAGIWAALPKTEKRRFARHLKPYWEIVRHRVAPATLEASARMRDAGTLKLGKGSLSRLERLPDHRYQAEWRHASFGKAQGVFDHVINATGFSARLAGSASPLLRQLHQNGWIREDEIGLGIDTSSDYCVVNQNGAVLPNLFYVGPMLRARYWECTAVPELRLRAAEAAACMLVRASSPA
jgi:uncharacterized NAD(P)/FAD-binding protein YdhS/predicted metal-dependent enzyme (double-stranded beta helix superfamily)